MDWFTALKSALSRWAPEPPPFYRYRYAYMPELGGHHVTAHNGTGLFLCPNPQEKLCHTTLVRPKKWPEPGNFVSVCQVSYQEITSIISAARFEQPYYAPAYGDPAFNIKGRMVLAPISEGVPWKGAVAFLDFDWPEGERPDMEQIVAHAAVFPVGLVKKLLERSPAIEANL